MRTNQNINQSLTASNLDNAGEIEGAGALCHGTACTPGIGLRVLKEELQAGLLLHANHVSNSQTWQVKAALAPGIHTNLWSKMAAPLSAANFLNAVLLSKVQHLISAGHPTLVLVSRDNLQISFLTLFLPTNFFVWFSFLLSIGLLAWTKMTSYLSISTFETFAPLVTRKQSVGGEKWEST